MIREGLATSGAMRGAGSGKARPSTRTMRAWDWASCTRTWLKAGKAAGTGCLGVSGSGVFDRADSGGGGEQVPQRGAGDVVGISSDDDDDEGVRRGGGEVADAEGVKATESAEGGCSCLGGGEGQSAGEDRAPCGRR